MIIGIGTQIVKTERILPFIYQDQLHNIFSVYETNHARDANMFELQLAGFYAARLAYQHASGEHWRPINDIYIRHFDGKPVLRLNNDSSAYQIHLSITYTDDMAVATVVLERLERNPSGE